MELDHPKKSKAIASSTVKTDRIDAKTLAHLAWLDYLPVAYAAPKKTRGLRLYVRHGNSLVAGDNIRNSVLAARYLAR